ncbi:LPS export ABC transporter periplasmic protein LptC [Aureimonas sp. N4]|uniref:LPS export ABC transporter periplasmic protein LptC n=1 Tax=Aureimonas sp. N4 TaxID=1638165 RepID=UPI00078571CC|nr:LPS export ABC transporter periplasmic protein LptC [Aureimonas sp. N4]
MQARIDSTQFAQDPRHAALASRTNPKGDERREREFRRARRHSRWVRWLKIGLPTVATVIVLAGLGVTWLARVVPGDLAFASTSIQDGRLVMSDPRMSGVDGRDRPYSMLANRAIQTLGGSGVDLEGVRADLTVDDNTKAQLQAAKGHYDTRTQMLRLYDDITVETTSGIRIKLASADVSLQDGQLTGKGPVNIATPNQTLEAGSVVIVQRGHEVSFRDRVKLTLLPTANNGATPPSSEPRP